MYEISQKFATYLMDVYRIRDTTEEAVEAAIRDIFQVKRLPEDKLALFESWMALSLNITWISNVLEYEVERYNNEVLEAQREDHADY